MSDYQARSAITHFRWSPKRSGQIILIASLFLWLIPVNLPSLNYLHHPVSQQDLHKIISRYYPQNPELIKAIIGTESEWKSSIVSSKGAIGLMQVIPASAKMVGLNYDEEDLKCPEKNIEAGTRILHYYRMRSRTLDQALNRYSGGAYKYPEKVKRRMQG